MSIAFLNFIGWEVAIDEEGDFVIIEWNSPQLSQFAFKLGMENILKELSKNFGRDRILGSLIKNNTISYAINNN